MRNLSLFLILTIITSSQACFFPTNESSKSNVKSAKKLAQMAAPLMRHMRVTVGDTELFIRENTTQVIDNAFEASLVVVPLSKTDGENNEQPCLAGFLRVQNISNEFRTTVSRAQICYETPRVESQLNDPNLRVTITDDHTQTCLNFENTSELSPKGEPNDFSNLIWYVCQTGDA